MRQGYLRSGTRFVLAMSALAMSLGGCRCNDTVQRGKGEISVVYDDMGVTKTSTTEGIYDFGTVPMGKTVHLKLTVKNTGNGSLFLQSLTKDDTTPPGDAVNIANGMVEGNPVFELPDWAGNDDEIGAANVKEYDLVFHSLQDDTQASVDHLTKLTLTASNTQPGAEHVSITLKGKSVSGECDIPKTLDFGAVSRGDSFSSADFMPPAVIITNTRPIDSQAFVGDITSSSGDDKAFTFSPDSPKGDFTIGTMKTRAVTISFSPTEIKDYLALVTMRAADGCPDVVVKLVGTGVDSVLTWAPNPLDFGYITPGLQADGKLTFSNLGLKPVNLTNFVTTPNPSDFKTGRRHPGGARRRARREQHAAAGHRRLRHDVQALAARAAHRGAEVRHRPAQAAERRGPAEGLRRRPRHQRHPQPAQLRPHRLLRGRHPGVVRHPQDDDSEHGHPAHAARPEGQPAPGRGRHRHAVVGHARR